MTVSHPIADAMKIVRESNRVFIKKKIRGCGMAQFEVTPIEALRGLMNDAIRIDSVRLHFDETDKALYIEELE